MGSAEADRDFYITSYDTHNFFVRFKDGSTGETKFTKSAYDEIVTVFCDEASHTLELEIHHPFDQMESLLEEAFRNCPDSSHPEHSDCLTHLSFPAMDKLLQHQQDVKDYRDKITDKLRNYTCADESLNTSTPISSAKEFVYDKEYTVNTYLKLDHAKIWSVPDFVTDEECAVLMDHGLPRLERAVVVGDGEAFFWYDVTILSTALRIPRDKLVA